MRLSSHASCQIDRCTENVILTLDGFAVVQARSQSRQPRVTRRRNQQSFNQVNPCRRVRRSHENGVSDRLHQSVARPECCPGQSGEAGRHVGGILVALHLRQRGIASEIDEAKAGFETRG